MSADAWEAVIEGVADGQSFGYDPNGQELWVGEGPKDPNRRTFAEKREHVAKTMRGLAALTSLVEMFRYS